MAQNYTGFLWEKLRSVKISIALTEVRKQWKLVAYLRVHPRMSVEALQIRLAELTQVVVSFLADQISPGSLLICGSDRDGWLYIVTTIFFLLLWLLWFLRLLLKIVCVTARISYIHIKSLGKHFIFLIVSKIRSANFCCTIVRWKIVYDLHTIPLVWTRFVDKHGFVV